MKTEQDILWIERIWTIAVHDVSRDYDNVSVLDSYDDAELAMQCAEKLYNKVRKKFVKEFGKDGFTSDDENLTLCSNDDITRYEVSVTQCILARTEEG